MPNAWLDEREWILFCDESVGKGEYFSNFYGGALVKASQYERITRKLKTGIKDLGISGEIKWSKTTESRRKAYLALVTSLFSEVRSDNVKIRIMFTHDYHVPVGLTNEQRANEYFILYYQFIKHAFGFHSLPARDSNTWLRIYFDQFPDTKAKIAAFREYIFRLQSSEGFAVPGIQIRREDIAEVRSHDHPILQGLDVVIGAMAFRLNDRHKAKPPGARVRGSRTRAKERLYRDIRALICEIKPHFNAGISTGTSTEYPTRWDLPYAHWKFVPRQHRADERKAKKKPRGAY